MNILYRKSSAEETGDYQRYEDKFSNPYRAAERGLIDRSSCRAIPLQTGAGIGDGAQQESEQSTEKARQHAFIIVVIFYCEMRIPGEVISVGYTFK